MALQRLTKFEGSISFGYFLQILSSNYTKNSFDPIFYPNKKVLTFTSSEKLISRSFSLTLVSAI